MNVFFVVSNALLKSTAELKNFRIVEAFCDVMENFVKIIFFDCWWFYFILVKDTYGNRIFWKSLGIGVSSD